MQFLACYLIFLIVLFGVRLTILVTNFFTLLRPTRLSFFSALLAYDAIFVSFIQAIDWLRGSSFHAVSPTISAYCLLRMRLSFILALLLAIIAFFSHSTSLALMSMPYFSANPFFTTPTQVFAIFLSTIISTFLFAFLQSGSLSLLKLLLSFLLFELHLVAVCLKVAFLNVQFIPDIILLKHLSDHHLS